MSRRDFSESVIAQIDKDRRTGAAKARDAQVIAEARLGTFAAILRMPPSDRVRHCEGMLDGIREALTAELDHAGASSIIAAKAYQPIIAMGAKARAEQAFARLYVANDEAEA